MELQGNQDADRRRFLRAFINCSSGLIAALTLAPGIGFVLAPALRLRGTARRKAFFRRPDDAASTSFVAVRYEGQEETAPGLFVRMANGLPEVLSARCTHASCTVDWRPSEGRFICPCHGGVYDASGKNISGPPPRPLDRLSATVADGQLFVEVPEA